MTHWIFVVLISFLWLPFAFTQEGAGLIYGNYNGLSSASINPSAILKSKHKWEFQLGGLHLNVQSNYGFIAKSSLNSLAKEMNQIFTESDGVNPNQGDFVFNNNDKLKFFDSKVNLLGPGFMFSINPYTKIGISSSIKSAFSVFGIPTIFNYDNLKINLRNQEVTVPNRNAAGMIWEEVAFHYASFWDQVDFGATLKLLMPLHVGYVNNVNDFSYDLDSDSNLLALSSGMVEFGYKNPTKDNFLERIGIGFALDLGWQFPNFLDSNSSLGISILDLGVSKVNASKYSVLISENQSINTIPYEFVMNETEFLELSQSDDLNVDSVSYFMLYSPTAISVQYQIPISKKLIFNAAIVQRVKLFDQQIARANSINGTLMYETKHFSAFMPISLYNFSKVRMGLAFRIGYLTIGTDKLVGTLWKDNSFDGADFYIKLNAYPFWKKRKKKHKKKEKIKGKKVRCPKI